ncbi:MAG TPA: gamma-glutamyltransferase [Vicinamibacterales bacterium]|nr:gamma-glutamyltransferase [Vicinamibacterales bacterium]
MRAVLSITIALFLAQSVTTTQDAGVPSKDGLVVCVSAPACDAGAAVLARGGNAVDAAVATAFALAVTHPAAGNIGGGGFMIVRTASGEVTAFDYRERAPLRSTRTMYLNEAGNIDRSLTAAGYLAPGVPGTVRGLELAHRKFGKLPWKDVVMPAVALAQDGFALSAALARGLNREVAGPMARFPASVAAYGKPGGGEWKEGERLVLGALARTLRAIADGGADAFYQGAIADLIEADMKANGGIITKEDLSAYQAKERAPVRGTYRGFEIVSMPPPSSGGVALVQMLNILEQFDLESKGLLSAPDVHLRIEAMRRAYLDRARHLGDPDFVDVPVARLTAKDYAKTLAASIDPDKASSSLALGKDIVAAPAQEPAETTHFSVIDREGMAVTSTYTLEGSYGSHVVVKGAGFLLNNEMGDFNKKPGETNTTGDIGTPANLIDPGKRMLSSMTPTMVLRDGKTVLLTGSPGGRTIINTVLTIVLGVTEFGLTGRQAVDAARLHHQWLPDRTTIEEGGVSAETLEKLRAMGHDVRAQGRQGDAHSIWIAPDGTVYGVNDRRSPDSKASTPGRSTSPAGGR